MVTTIWLIAGCIQAGGSDGSLGPASQQPSRIPAASPAGGTIDLPASITDPVVAEIARDAGVPIDQVAIVSAAAVTFPDGSLGCPEPGMAYQDGDTVHAMLLVDRSPQVAHILAKAPAKES